jgi:hypothetical protein
VPLNPHQLPISLGIGSFLLIMGLFAPRILSQPTQKSFCSSEPVAKESAEAI